MRRFLKLFAAGIAAFCFMQTAYAIAYFKDQVSAMAACKADGGSDYYCRWYEGQYSAAATSCVGGGSSVASVYVVCNSGCPAGQVPDAAGKCIPDPCPAGSAGTGTSFRGIATSSTWTSSSPSPSVVCDGKCQVVPSGAAGSVDCNVTLPYPGGAWCTYQGTKNGGFCSYDSSNPAPGTDVCAGGACSGSTGGDGSSGGGGGGTTPAVCNGGDGSSGTCVCPSGYSDQGGTCTANAPTPATCNGGDGSSGTCICPTGTTNNAGTCTADGGGSGGTGGTSVTCNGGDGSSGTCVCPSGQTDVNGTCTANSGTGTGTGTGAGAGGTCGGPGQPACRFVVDERSTAFEGGVNNADYVAALERRNGQISSWAQWELDSGVFSWEWRPVVPSMDCNDPAISTGGWVLRFSGWCEKAEMIRDLGAYAMYVLSAFLLFRIVTGSAKSGGK